MPRPRPRWTDAVTNLRHFALITYDVEPDVLAARLPPRLAPLTVPIDGSQRALVSVVSFLNVNFRPAAFPFPGMTMPQMNYRGYVVDRVTGEHGIWFLAIVLDGWPFVVPRLLWKMPWNKGPIDLQVRLGGGGDMYESYFLMSSGGFAPAHLELQQDVSPADEPSAPARSGDRGAGDDGPPTDPAPSPGPDPSAARPSLPELVELPGFPDAETGLVCLTHGAKGWYRRFDGKIGLNEVWHRPIPVRPARLLRASFPLLHRLGLVARMRHDRPYNVLLSPGVEMWTKLPPTVVSDM